MRGERAGLAAATFIWRWNQANGILGIVFSALTFLGVFVLLLGPVSLVFLGMVVLALMLGLGTVLDRVVKFWVPQSVVATARNPFLRERLYMKEIIKLSTSELPQLRALRYILTFMPTSSLEPKYQDARHALIFEIDAAISRTREAVTNKKWDVRDEEDPYDGQGK